MNSRISRNRVARAWRVTAAAAALVAGGAVAAPASEWTWSVTPYAWATDLGVDLAIDDREVVDDTIAFEDLIDQIDTVAQVQLEGQRGAHGVLFDLFDVNLTEDTQRFALPSGNGDAAVTPEIGMTILDLAGIYDPQGDHQGFELLYGARVIDQRLTIDALFEPTSGATSVETYETRDTLVDALVGLRYLHRVSRRWSYQMRVDVSAGGTDYTWSAGPTVAYAFGKDERYAISAGYRRMVIEFDADEPVSAGMTLSGFLAGLRIGF